MVKTQQTSKMNATPKFNSRYSLYCKQFGNTSRCRIYILMTQSHRYSFPRLGLQPSHPSSAFPTSQRPTQLCPTYTAYSWRTERGKFFSTPMEFFFIFFFPPVRVVKPLNRCPERSQSSSLEVFKFLQTLNGDLTHAINTAKRASHLTLQQMPYKWPK